MPEKSSSEANDKAVVPWKLADQDTFKTSIVSSCYYNKYSQLKAKPNSTNDIDDK